MKVNLNKNFKDAFGKEITTEAAPTMAHQLAVHLFTANTLRGQQLSQEQKYRCYLLQNKIATAEGEVELTAEEITLAKDVAAETFTAGAYGQIVDALEGK